MQLLLIWNSENTSFLKIQSFSSTPVRALINFYHCYVKLSFSELGGIYRHPDYYEDPDVFEPERYLKHEFGIKSGVDPTGCRNDFQFGAGRVCIPFT